MNQETAWKHSCAQSQKHAFFCVVFESSFGRSESLLSACAVSVFLLLEFWTISSFWHGPLSCEVNIVIFWIVFWETSYKLPLGPYELWAGSAPPQLSNFFGRRLDYLFYLFNFVSIYYLMLDGHLTKLFCSCGIELLCRQIAYYCQHFKSCEFNLVCCGTLFWVVVLVVLTFGH